MEYKSKTSSIPLVSIIIPVFNTAFYLRRCIESILLQSFEDFELILIDDGSQDNCGTICDEYAAKDERVRVIHKSNQGVSAARNDGIREAKGTFLMFCDSDDFVDRDWVRCLYNQAIAVPDAFIACGMNLFETDDTNEAKDDSFAKDCIDVPRKVTYFELFKRGLSAYTCNKIYLRNTLIDSNIKFDNSIDLSEDVKFNVAYRMKCSCDLLIDKPLYFYRQNSNGASKRYRPELLELLIMPFWCRLPLISEENLKEYCTNWFFVLYRALDNVFDERNTEMSFYEKVKLNSGVVASREFQFCVENADTNNENRLILYAIRKKKYWLLFILQRISRIKQRLHNKFRGALKEGDQ